MIKLLRHITLALVSRPALSALAMLLFLNTETLSAQTFITRSQEIRLGMYAGKGGYFGEYNPGMFGSPFVYGFDALSPQKQSSFTENHFGAWLKLPLNPTFGVLLKGDFGTLGYEDPGLNYVMNTRFQGFSAAIEINPFTAFLVQPYLTVGAGLLRYDIPPPIPDVDLAQFSSGTFGAKAQSVFIPATIGVSYPISDRTAFFAEYSFNMSQSDNLDNLALPGNLASSSLANDGFTSVRVGIHVAILKFFNLKRNKKAVRRPAAYEPAQDASLAIETEQLRPVKLIAGDTLRMYWEATKAEQDKLKLKGTPSSGKPLANATPLKPAPGLIPPPAAAAAAVAAVIPKKIPVSKPPEERAFKQEEQKAVVQQVQTERSKARQEAQEAAKLAAENPSSEIAAAPIVTPIKDKKELKNIADRSDPRLYTDETDPFIPKVLIKPRAIPEDIIVDGFVTRDPPVGYYVQVYATIGPISAQRSRQKTIDLLKNVLEDAETQVIITQRRQFYEVRIGVFDTYDDTMQVLEQVLGTYFDAYTLIYLSDNL